MESVEINGSATPHSEVIIKNSYGKILGATKADYDGNYRLSVELPYGTHKLKAWAKAPGMRSGTSAEMEVEVSALTGTNSTTVNTLPAQIDGAPAATESLLPADVAEEMDAAAANAREEGLESYHELLRAIIEGHEIDYAAGEQILDAAGKTVADLSCDLDECLQVSARALLGGVVWGIPRKLK